MANYIIQKREETLDNGLHVILVHKPEYVKSLFLLSAPVGGYDIQQMVDGEIVKHPTGCAHFLEHKMFNYQGGDVTDEFARMQCSTNAFTSHTETAYYFHTTSDVEEPLKLLLDFVQNLNITQESVDKEKGIILSEYNMYQQNPETHVMRNTWTSLYEKHPMNTDILGKVEDIENMTVEDLKKFYELNYDPSRCTLVGITGKDIDGIFEIIKEHQSHVPSKNLGKVERYIEDEKKEVVQLSTSDEMEISTPYVCVGYKLNYFDDMKVCLEHDYALMTCFDALFTTLNADYQKWMDERILTQTFWSECDIGTDRGYMVFFAQTDKIDEFVQIIEETVHKMQTELLDADIVKSLTKRSIASNIRGFEFFEGMAMDMIHAHNQGYDYIESLKYVEKFTPEKILSLMQDFDFSNKTISTMYPKNSNEAQ